MGWSIVANPHDAFAPVYVASGVHGLVRGGEGTKDLEPYQEYKLRLVEYFTAKAEATISNYLPVVLAGEIQPAVGGGNFVAATQSELAKTSMVIYQAAAFATGLKVVQFGSNTIKKTLTGNAKASKVKVRDAVIEHFPELTYKKKDWQASKEGFDECDAIAHALVYWLTRKFL